MVILVSCDLNIVDLSVVPLTVMSYSFLMQRMSRSLRANGKRGQTTGGRAMDGMPSDMKTKKEREGGPAAATTTTSPTEPGSNYYQHNYNSRHNYDHINC